MLLVVVGVLVGLLFLVGCGCCCVLLLGCFLGFCGCGLWAGLGSCLGGCLCGLGMCVVVGFGLLCGSWVGVFVVCGCFFVDWCCFVGVWLGVFWMGVVVVFLFGWLV